LAEGFPEGREAAAFGDEVEDFEGLGKGRCFTLLPMEGGDFTVEPGQLGFDLLLGRGPG
jgi:hypothetical protein